MLLLEDDVRFRPDWRELLAFIVSADVPTVCCTLPKQCIPAPYGAWVRAQEDGQLPDVRVPPRIVPLVRPISFFGTQATYWPRWFLPTLMSREDLHARTPSGKAFDGFLNVWMQEGPTPLGMSIVVPDLAHHLSPPDVLTGRRGKRQEHMFGWEVEW